MSHRICHIRRECTGSPWCPDPAVGRHCLAVAKQQPPSLRLWGCRSLTLSNFHWQLLECPATVFCSSHMSWTFACTTGRHEIVCMSLSVFVQVGRKTAKNINVTLSWLLGKNNARLTTTQHKHPPAKNAAGLEPAQVINVNRGDCNLASGESSARSVQCLMRARVTAAVTLETI